MTRHTAIAFLALVTAGCRPGRIDISIPPGAPPELSVTARAGSAHARWTAPEGGSLFRLYSSPDALSEERTQLLETTAAEAIVPLPPGVSWLSVATVTEGVENDSSPRVAVTSLSGPPLETSPSFEYEANQANANAGFPLVADDVTGDGIEDLVAGIHNWDDGGDVNSGAVVVFAGDRLSTLDGPVAMRLGLDAQDIFGHGVTTGDFDCDSYRDILVGAFGAEGTLAEEGQVTLLPGNPARLPTTLPGNQTSGGLGASVHALGDVNGDGCDDFASGAYVYDFGFTDNGRLQLHLGGASGITTAPLGWSFAGETNFAGIGVHSGNLVGDVNGDGFEDLGVGAVGINPGAPQPGRAYVFFGGSLDYFSLEPDWSDVGPANLDAFGLDVRGADVNADGYSDLFVSAAGDSGGGTAFLYMGGPAGPSLTPDREIHGIQAGESFSRGLAVGRDVNGDGFLDAAMGAMLHDGAFTNEGRVVLYLGTANGLSAEPAWEAHGELAEDALGMYETFGDFDDDGLADLAVGRFMRSNGQSSEGGFVVFRGRAMVGPTAFAGTPHPVPPGAPVTAPLARFSDVSRSSWTCRWTLGEEQAEGSCVPGDLAAPGLLAPDEPGDYELHLRVTAFDGRIGNAVTTVRVLDAE